MSTPQELPAPLGAVDAPLPQLAVVPQPVAYAGDADALRAPVDDDDFTDFVRRHSMRLRSLVVRRIGDPADAEEITQETLLRAYQHRLSFTAETELIAWSTVVAQRLVIDRLRVRGRCVAVAEVPESARMGRDTADIVVGRHEARTALESLEAIPSRQAAILWAREVEGLHYEEIAERFDISEPAVRSLLHRGRRALRKEYASRGGSLPLHGLVPLGPWLIALKGLDRRVRSLVRSSTSNGGAVAGALSLAAVAILGAGTFFGGLALPNERALPPGSTYAEPVGSATTHSAISTTTARLDGGTVGTSALGPTLFEHLPRQACAAQTDTSVQPCVSSNPDYQGGVLWIGPPLPENPTGYNRVGFNVSVVDPCMLEVKPLTECRSSQSAGRPISSLPSSGGNLQ